MTSFSKHFEVCFQDPFGKDNFSNVQQSDDAALKGFDAIDWAGLNQATHEKHQDVLEDFYFYEVRDAQHGDSSAPLHAINISGESTYGDQLKTSGALLTLRYIRPVETLSKGFFGFGAGKMKIDSLETVMEGCDIAFSRLCLEAFVRADKTFLAASVIDNCRSD
jgi:hypothetical protein